MHTGENQRNDNRLYESFHLVMDFLDSFFHFAAAVLAALYPCKNTISSAWKFNFVIQPVSRGAGDDEVDCLERMRTG